MDVKAVGMNQGLCGPLTAVAEPKLGLDTIKFGDDSGVPSLH